MILLTWPPFAACSCLSSSICRSSINCFCSSANRFFSFPSCCSAIHTFSTFYSYSKYHKQHDYDDDGNDNDYNEEVDDENGDDNDDYDNDNDDEDDVNDDDENGNDNDDDYRSYTKCILHWLTLTLVVWNFFLFKKDRPGISDQSTLKGKLNFKLSWMCFDDCWEIGFWFFEFRRVNIGGFEL